MPTFGVKAQDGPNSGVVYDFCDCEPAVCSAAEALSRPAYRESAVRLTTVATSASYYEQITNELRLLFVAAVARWFRNRRNRRHRSLIMVSVS